MKSILFISMYPFPPNTGSKQHSYYFLKSLSSRYNVFCIFFVPPHQQPPQHPGVDLNGLRVIGYEICRFNLPDRKRNSYYGYLNKLFTFPNAYMNLAINRVGLRAIADSIERYQIDIVHFEHFWVTGYAFKIQSHIKKVIVYHDLHHTIYKQIASLENRYHRKLIFLVEAAKFYIYERLLEKKVDLKIFLNPVEMLSFPNRSVHIPHIVNAEIRFRPARKTNLFNILFIGAYNHPPNQRSVAFIVQNILPRLVEMKQWFKIHIVGPDTEKFSELVNASPYRDHVVIHGFKKDINEAFLEMDIALFPILDGGGIKTKLIDALAAGVPVVTTPKGVEGLEGLPEDVIAIGNTPDALIKEIYQLMCSDSLRYKRSYNGRIFIDRQHAYGAFSNKVVQTFAGL